MVWEEGDADEDDVQCDKCMRHFASGFLLKTHLSALYRCDICCKEFSSRERLSKYIIQGWPEIRQTGISGFIRMV